MLRNTPSDRITAGIESQAAALVDLRKSMERAAVEAAARHATLVDGEYKFTALKRELWNTRRPRVLRPGEEHGAERRLKDNYDTGLGPEDLERQRAAAKAVEQESLRKMGLLPRPHGLHSRQAPLLELYRADGRTMVPVDLNSPEVKEGWLRRFLSRNTSKSREPERE